MLFSKNTFMKFCDGVCGDVGLFSMLAFICALGVSGYVAQSTQFPSVLISSERQVLSYGLMLYAQNLGEGGRSFRRPSWKEAELHTALSYLDRVIAWMPASDYPFYVAFYVWGQWGNRHVQQEVVEWGMAKVRANPARYWRWGVQSIEWARYGLGDMEVALRYARVLQNQPGVPEWAQSLGAWIAESDKNERAAAQWIRELLKNPVLQAPAERRFLQDRLQTLEHAIEEKDSTKKQKATPLLP